MKKFIMGFILGAMLFSILPIYAATQTAINVTYNNIKLSVKGAIVPTDTEPFVYDNRTFVPVRFVAEALGMDIKYNEITDTVEITDKAIQSVEVESMSDNDITIMTYNDCEAVEKEGVIYIAIADGRNKYNYQVQYNQPIVTLYNAEKEVSFSKDNADYCIVYNSRTYIKLSVLEQFIQ